MKEIRCPKCNKMLGEAEGNFKLVNNDCDIRIQCVKCKTKTNIKLERL